MCSVDRSPILLKIEESIGEQPIQDVGDEDRLYDIHVGSSRHRSSDSMQGPKSFVAYRFGINSEPFSDEAEPELAVGLALR